MKQTNKQTIKQRYYITMFLAFFLCFCICITFGACVYDQKQEFAKTTKPLNEQEHQAIFDPIPKDQELTEQDQSKINADKKLSLKAAILMSLDNNSSFKMSRLDPKLMKIEEETQLTTFDPTIGASLYADKTTQTKNDTDSLNTEIRLKQYMPTGTTIDLGTGGDIQSSDNSSDTESRKVNVDITVTQALLRGNNSNANLALLHSAKLDTEISVYELNHIAETLISQVEEAYWDLILAKRSIEIYEKSLALAHQQVEEVTERIRIGKLAETELAAAQAEEASRQEQLIDAKGTLSKQRLTLIKLFNPTDNNSWDQNFELVDAPELPDLQLDTVESHIKVAQNMRPDINQAKLKIKKGELEIIRTKNGLLPKLDLFIKIGAGRYSNSFDYRNDETGTDKQYRIGVNFELPLGNRNANARYQKAILSSEQIKESMNNMEQLIQVDIRTAYVDVERMRERVKATEATRYFRDKTLTIEVEKFRLGRSTTFLMSQAQRDLIQSQIDAIKVIIEYRKAILNLYRLEGSLLSRWGVKIENL